MKLGRSKLKISAILIASMALIYFLVLHFSEKPWADEVAIEECLSVREQLPKFLTSNRLKGQCLKLRGTKVYVFNSELNHNGETIPVRTLTSSEAGKVERAIIRLVGGPGTAVLGQPGIESWSDKSKLLLSSCNAAVLTIAYSGTFHRSLYPESSEATAASEIATLVEKLEREGIRVHFLAESLGGRLFASEQVPIPSGEHFLFVPLLNSPNELIRWFENNPKRALIDATWQTYWIGPSDRQHRQSVLKMQFLRSFFDSEGGRMSQSFIELWAKKSNVDPAANVTVLLAENDEKAGNSTFRAPLEEMGFKVIEVPGEHETNTPFQEEQRFEIGSKFLSNVCAG